MRKAKMVYTPPVQQTPEQIAAAQAEKKAKEFAKAQQAVSLETVMGRIDAMMARFASQYEGVSKRVNRYGGVDSDRLTLEIEKAFAVGCTLYVSANTDFSERVTGMEPIGVGVQVSYTPCTIKCELSWSGTSRNLAQSQSSINLYTAMLALAADIETVASDERTIMKRFAFIR